MGSPRCFISARRGSVIGRRSEAVGGCEDTVSLSSARKQDVDLGVDAHDPVLGGDVDHARGVAVELRFVEVRIGDEDHGVAPVHESRGGAVDLHRTRPALAGDGVGLEARAVVDVHDVDLLVLTDVGGLEQLGVDGERAGVVQVAVADRGAVDLGLEHHPLHGACGAAVSVVAAAAATAAGARTVVLSIRRAGPTVAATTTSASAPGSIASSGPSVSGSTTSRYSGSTSCSAMAARPSSATAWGSRSPADTAASAAWRPCQSPTARARSAGPR